MHCQKCHQQNVTVHLTLIGQDTEPRKYHFCEACYAVAHKELGRAFDETSHHTVPSAAPATPETNVTKQQKCPRCSTVVSIEELDSNLKVCPHCEYHFPMGARERIRLLVEDSSFEERDAEMTSMDPLNFAGPVSYESNLADAGKASGEKDAVITGIGKIGEHRVGMGVLDFNFLGGSMGSVMGEKLTRLFEKCAANALPVIIISTSGGARVYEGMFSLMQLAKTCYAVGHHARRKLPFISVLTNPTTAGVLASFASLGGIIIAEPGAKIGFAGERAIKQITRKDLPPGFQTAEFLLDHGLIDAVVPRKDIKGRLIEYVSFTTVGACDRSI